MLFRSVFFPLMGGKDLNSFRTGAATRKTNHVITGLYHSAPITPPPPGGESGWRLSSITSDQKFHQSCLCNETLKKCGMSRFRGLMNTLTCWEGMVSRKRMKFCAFILCPINLFHWVVPELYSNKPVILRVVFSWVLWGNSKLVNLRGIMGTPKLVLGQAEVWIAWGLICGWYLKWGVVLLDWAINVGYVLIPVGVRVNCRTISWRQRIGFCLEKTSNA